LEDGTDPINNLPESRYRRPEVRRREPLQRINPIHYDKIRKRGPCPTIVSDNAM
jgi:hypothetical protein